MSRRTKAIASIKEAIESLESHYDGAPDSKVRWLGGPLDDLNRAYALLTKSPALPSPNGFTVGITLDGGLVQDVFSDDVRMMGRQYVVIDYDTEDADPASLEHVRQEDGKYASAFISGGTIERGTVRVPEEWAGEQGITAESVAGRLGLVLSYLHLVGGDDIPKDESEARLEKAMAELERLKDIFGGGAS